MNYQERGLRRWLLWLAVVAVLSVLYTHSQTDMPEQHSRITDNLHQLRQLDITLNQDFLKIRYGLLHHYDSLVDSMREIIVVQSRLDVDLQMSELGQLNEIRLHRQSVREVFERKERLLEKLKSQTSILRNSLIFLPVATAQVLEKVPAGEGGRLLREYLTSLERHSLIYYITSDARQRPRVTAKLQQLLALKSRLQTRWDRQLNEGVDNLVGHVRIVMKQKTMVDSMLHALIDLPTVKQLNLLSRANQNYYQERASLANGYQLALYLVSVLLLVYVGYILLKLSRSVTELEVVKSELKSIIDNTVDAIITTDEKGLIAHFNNAAESIFGRTATDVIGHSVTMLMSAKYRQQHPGGLGYLATGEANLMGENAILEGRRKDGSFFPLELAVNELRVTDQRMFTAIARDITARVKTEQKLADYRDSLEEQVKKRTTELELSNRELESYSYSIAHDLRAPLRAIAGYSTILQEDAGDKLDAEDMSNFDRIVAATHRMEGLIADILELGRVSQTKVRLVDVDLTALAQHTIEQLCTAGAGKDIDWQIQENLTVLGDEKLFGLLIENLLGNAVKYSSKKTQVCIEFGAVCMDGNETFFVKDNGAGFDMQYADKLFAPFQRLHASAEFEGSGVGLATVQRIVDRHYGRVWAEGAVDKGAAFYFTFELPCPLP
ncbi:MAG: PAS domain S-box protein [Ectothiorhodospiraceae bacterium]|nr:PAS domain S-box protein [Ectothiorhodospiraceae bacterium]